MKQQMGAEDTTLDLDLGPNSTTQRVQETEDLSNQTYLLLVFCFSSLDIWVYETLVRTTAKWDMFACLVSGATGVFFQTGI
jgi:hypothetical protein